MARRGRKRGPRKPKRHVSAEERRKRQLAWRNSPWRKHLESYMASHPKLDRFQAAREASKTYHRADTLLSMIGKGRKRR